MTDSTQATIDALKALRPKPTDPAETLAAIRDTPLIDIDVYLPLERAVLCADCNRIYRMERGSCPSCTGGSALNLSHVLSSEGNRELVEALRALSTLLAFAKRPSRPRKKKENT